MAERAIRTVLVEDEPLARDLLRSYLSLHADIELVAEAGNGREGLATVNQLRPDLVLLDIHMPELSGLALARALRYDPAIIFVTAFDTYALSAFELGAFDYVLKPVLPERFATALDRVRERHVARSSEPLELGTAMRLDTVLRPGYLEHFFVRRAGKLRLVHVADVVRLEAEDDYTAVFANGQRDLIHVALREMVKRLDPAHFIRVHRCDVVNLAHVRSSSLENRRVTLRLADGSMVVASRAGTQALKLLCP